MEKLLKNQQIPLTQVIDPETGQVYYSPQNVVYDQKNNNGPQYLKNVIVDSTISSSYALTASYALNGGGEGRTTDTGSLLVTSSLADNELTFTKGNGTIYSINLLSVVVENAYTASYINGGTF